MSTRLTLHVIAAADVPVRPSLDALGGVPLPEVFRRATGGELELVVVEQQSAVTSTGIDGAGLQSMFNQLVPSPSPGELASEVGLLFCRSWCFQDLAGLMFDYDGADLPAGARVVFDGVPRQACAVFVDAQGTFSPADLLYVAVHELGHVFNLHHDPQDASFMGFDVAAARSFLPADGAKLRDAAAGKFPERHEHLPGGAPFQAGAGFPRGAPDSAHGPASRKTSVAVTLGQQRFLPGEPVVLEVSVSVPPGATMVAPGLEPGYDGVRIWYRTPLGEVRLFSPIRRYCPIRKSKPRGRRIRRLTNNIRVHLNGHGFTFRHEGRYQAWVEVDVWSKSGRLSTLVSRAAPFEVCRPQSELERSVSAGLADPLIARFVANKAGRLDESRMQTLQDLSLSTSTEPALNHIRYALAHSLHRAGRDEEARAHMSRVHFTLPSLATGVRQLAAKVRARHGKALSIPPDSD